MCGGAGGTKEYYVNISRLRERKLCREPETENEMKVSSNLIKKVLTHKTFLN